MCLPLSLSGTTNLFAGYDLCDMPHLMISSHHILGMIPSRELFLLNSFILRFSTHSHCYYAPFFLQTVDLSQMTNIKVIPQRDFFKH